MSDVMISAPAPAQAPSEDQQATASLRGSVAESLALAVAPSTGRFHPQVGSGRLERGDLVGHVTGGRGRADDVRMPVDGHVEALLVRPGQLVRAGQCLAWLRREGTLSS